ncbi:S41 family peptidase [Thalassotalea montiporae]
MKCLMTRSMCRPMFQRMINLVGKLLLVLAVFWQTFVLAIEHEITPYQQQAVVEALSQVISQNYPDKEAADKMALALKGITWQASYQAPTNREELLELLRQTIASANHDSYVALSVQEQKGLSILSNHSMLVSDNSTINAEQANINQDGIGYFKLNNFHSGAQATLAIDKAMQTLQESCALILDFSALDDGDIKTAEYLLSYFFAPEHSFGSLVNNNRNEQLALASNTTIGGQRFSEQVPVVLMTSPFMQASGEFFAYQLKQRPQTALIGRSTMGVATWLKTFNLPLGLQIELPVAYYQDGNGENWQQIGVTPDIDIAIEDSLVEAQRLTAQWCKSH